MFHLLLQPWIYIPIKFTYFDIPVTGVVGEKDQSPFQVPELEVPGTTIDKAFAKPIQGDLPQESCGFLPLSWGPDFPIG